MASVADIDVIVRLKQAAAVNVAGNPGLVRALLLGGGGAALGAGLGSALTHSHDEAARHRAQNTGFGAGVATGMAGPQIIDALHAIAHGGAQ